MSSRLTRLLLIVASPLLLNACASTPYQPTDLKGNVSYREKIALPTQNTMVHLRLLDVSGSGGAARLMAEQFINQPAHFPVAFDLQYDQSGLVAQAHYELITELYANGELRMQDNTPLTAEGKHLPEQVDVVVKGVGQ